MGNNITPVPFAMGELGNLRGKDISFGEANAIRFLALLLPNRRQVRMGMVYRSLIASSGAICVVGSLARRLSQTKWYPEGNRRVFGGQIPKSLRKLLRRSCAINGLPDGMYSAHSIRVGGATSLHCNGIPFEAIRRFGRWVSGCFKNIFT